MSQDASTKPSKTPITGYAWPFFVLVLIFLVGWVYFLAVPAGMAAAVTCGAVFLAARPAGERCLAWGALLLVAFALGSEGGATAVALLSAIAMTPIWLAGLCGWEFRWRTPEDDEPPLDLPLDSQPAEGAPGSRAIDWISLLWSVPLCLGLIAFTYFHMLWVMDQRAFVLWWRDAARYDWIGFGATIGVTTLLCTVATSVLFPSPRAALAGAAILLLVALPAATFSEAWFNPSASPSQHSDYVRLLASHYALTVATSAGLLWLLRQAGLVFAPRA